MAKPLNAPDVTTKPIMAKDATLRDMFAGQALIGLVSNASLHEQNGEFSIQAYKYADAMLAERQKGQQ